MGKYLEELKKKDKEISDLSAGFIIAEFIKNRAEGICDENAKKCCFAH